MILGGIVGAFWGPGASVLAPWANIFLNLLYCCVVPMIFISLVYAIAGMDNMRKLGKVLAVLLVLFLITGVVCSGYMVGFTALFDPAKNTDMTQFAQESVDLSGTNLDILAMFTVSDFSLLWSRTNLMALVVYAILTGIAVVMAGEKAKPVVTLLEGLNEVMVKLVGIVMKLAPVGLGFYFAILIGTNGRDIVGPLSRSFLTYVAAILIYYFVGHSIMAYLGGGRKAVALYWKNNVTPSLTALGTCSTAATLPYNMIAGKKMDPARFEHACECANRTAKAWLKVCDYLQYKPAPYSGFDLFNHMADVVTARGKVQAAEAFELLDKDLEAAVKEGKSTTPFPEQYRVMFEGIPCWPKLPNLFKPLKANGVNVTAVVYAPAFGFVYNNIDEMARAYYKAPNSVCIEQGVAWREGICKDNKVDGVLVHYNRSCKPWSGYMAEMQRRFTKDLGVPCAGFDGDQADPRNFNEAQYETRVQGLVEAMEANKAAKEGAEK